MKRCATPHNTTCMYQRPMARDEAPDDGASTEAFQNFWRFVTENLSPDAIGEAETLLKVFLDASGSGLPAMDEPPPFSGRPSPGGRLDPIASDGASVRRGRMVAASAFAKRFPGTSRIKVLG